MFGGFETVLVFVFTVMPGVMLIAGYHGRGKEGSHEGSALEKLAQAVAYSLLILAIPAPFLAADLVSWIEDGSVGDHLGLLIPVGYLTIFGPFVVGMLLTRLAEAWPWLDAQLTPHTAWNEARRRLGDKSRTAIVTLGDSSTIEGTIEMKRSQLSAGGRIYLSDVGPPGEAGTDAIVTADDVTALRLKKDPPPSGGAGSRGRRRPGPTSP
jgi:hypothetical protein